VFGTVACRIGFALSRGKYNSEHKTMSAIFGADTENRLLATWPQEQNRRASPWWFGRIDFPSISSKLL